MAKKSKLAKFEKQKKMVAQYAELRKKMKDEKDDVGLSKLPKDANPIRMKLRDNLDGRPRGYMRKFNLSRINFRKLAHEGKLPGVKKSSW